MGVELRKLPECIYCHAELKIGADAHIIHCPSCGNDMEVSRFTREDKRLADIIEAAASDVQDAARRCEQAGIENEALVLKQAEENFRFMQERLNALHSKYESALNRRLQTRFELAEIEQRMGRFDRAMQLYQELLVESPDKESEVYWRIVMCEYGVEYVHEQSSDRFLPTITHMVVDPVQKNPHFLWAMEYAQSEEIRKHYAAQARELDRILDRYRAVRSSEPSYDVFISVKQGDENGNPTEDCVAGIELYQELTNRGLHVFNSRKSLQKYAGMDYEPYIMAALMSARVMIVLGSSAEYLRAPWVHNEWRRFRWLKENDDPSRRLIPFLIGMPLGQQPAEMGSVQAISTTRVDPIGTLFSVLKDVFGSRFDDRIVIPDEIEEPPAEYRCGFCGSMISVPAKDAGDCCRCSFCGNSSAPMDGQSDCAAQIEDAQALRDRRAFGEAANRYGAILTLYPGSYQAVLGRVLSRMQVAYVPSGKDASGDLRPMLCAAPDADALAEADDAIRQLSSPILTIPRAERESCLNLLHWLRDTAESYLRTAAGPGWDVVLCCNPADHTAAAGICSTLTGWGYRAFLFDPQLRGAAAKEQEISSMHAAFTAKVMLAVSSCSEHFFTPAMENEWLRFYEAGGEMIPVLLEPDVELPPEFNPMDALVWQDGNGAKELMFQDLGRLLPDVTACNHEHLMLEIAQSGAQPFVRRCVKCGWTEICGRPVAGEQAARIMQQCMDHMDRRDFARAASATLEAAGMARQKAAGASPDVKAQLQEQMLLMSYMNYCASLGLWLYRTPRGWQSVIGAAILPDAAALKKRYAMLKERLGEELGDILDAAQQAAESIALQSSPERCDVCLNLRMPVDGGSDLVNDFAKLLTRMMREKKLTVYNPGDAEGRSYWGFRAAEQHSAAFFSEWMLVLTASREDTRSAEVRAQSDRFPRDRRVQYLELAEGAAEGRPNSKLIPNCDEANAGMLAERIRQTCVRYYKSRIEQLWSDWKRQPENLLWYCNRGMELASGDDMRDFQCYAAVLYGQETASFYDPKRCDAMLREAARYGNQKAIALCRSRRISY